MKFKPETLAHRVIIKPLITKKTDWGFEIVRDERMQAVNTDKGELFMKGPSCEFGLDKVNIGDKVYYSKYGAKLLKDEDTGEMYLICNDEDILVGYE